MGKEHMTCSHPTALQNAEVDNPMTLTYLMDRKQLKYSHYTLSSDIYLKLSQIMTLHKVISDIDL